jgi:hypothetical protein
MDEEVYRKIIKKKEFSDLPKKDVELAFSKFDNKRYLDEEKIKLTRDLLRKIFSVFTSKKILSLKNKDAEWVLKKHFSTRERLPYYEKIYTNFLGGMGEISVIDLGAGVNGFSYDYFEKVGCDVNYVGVEAMGQLVDLMNNYFKTAKISGKAFHESLFELEKIKKIVEKTKQPRVLFLFKVFDSLEMLERNYSKKLLLELFPFTDKVIISFATKSLVSRKKFNVQRKWLTDFIEDNFNILDDFELGGERYICFKKK